MTDFGKLLRDQLSDGLYDVLAQQIETLIAENERLRERLGPRGLEVVMIDGTGHYVNEKVKAEIDRLRAALERIIDHDPSKPGLRYESAEQLLESLIATAEDTLAAQRGGGKS